MNYASKKNEILQIIAKDIPIQEKINAIKLVAYTYAEVKCFSCKAKQNAAMKLLEQEKTYEINQLQKKLNG